jgi:3-oxoacyl-[acyl-carrier protein] reductase
MQLLEGKYALITGGGRGIGKAIAIEFAKNGANIIITALEKDELDETLEEIEKYNIKSHCIPEDLSTIEGVKNCVSRYFKYFEKCDILINNAGISHYSSVLDYPLEKAVKLFNLNIIASYAITKLILPQMIEQGSGNIIMTSSSHGNLFFIPKKVAYSTSKAAISVMGKCLQAELAPHNIRVNVVLPGAIKTKMFLDDEKSGQYSPEPIPPEIISPIYLFLASKLSDRRYKGRIIDQFTLFELLSKLEKEINGKDYNITELSKLMKEKLNKSLYSDLRKNSELIDFLLKY